MRCVMVDHHSTGANCTTDPRTLHGGGLFVVQDAVGINCGWSALVGHAFCAVNPEACARCMSARLQPLPSFMGDVELTAPRWLGAVHSTRSARRIDMTLTSRSCSQRE